MIPGPTPKIQLIPIEEFPPTATLNNADIHLTMVLTATRDLYSRIGFHKPWIGYLAVHNGLTVGTCGFKSPPSDNSVEIAYFTFPQYEGNGYATEMCRLLTALANTHDTGLAIRARTLKEKNASTHILEKNGFVFLGVVNDPEDGDVWEWEYHGALSH